MVGYAMFLLFAAGLVAVFGALDAASQIVTTPGQEWGVVLVMFCAMIASVVRATTNREE